MERLRHEIILFAAVLLSVLAASAYAVSPRVIKTIPKNGDQNVDPGLRQIRIEFDQDMSCGGYSVCGGGANYPKTIGKPKWINKRTIVMRVKLEPTHEYELSVNCPSYKNFKNLQGESAVIYPIKFKTTTAGEKSSTPTKSPSLLLQEGLYAEETEGDLEKAINLYEQVLEQYKDVERLGARATYQLGMCYLKKGDKEKAAQYFQEVVDYYPEQKNLVKKAAEQLEKASSVKDIIARSYVIHYKAVDQLQDALELLNKNHPEGVKTYHANRYHKNGETIDSICTDNEAGKDKVVAAINDSSELELVEVVPPLKQAETKESIFEQIDYQVTRFLGEKFGETAIEAGQLHLSVNSHIYYVDRDGFRYQGGMNAFYNWTGRTITQKVRFGGTSYPNQTHYGVDGNKLNTEIVPDKTRPNHWQIYWIPDEPLAPEEALYYGWSMDNKRKTSKLPGDVYSLTMDNKYGQPVIETFFLVLPKDLKISKSNSPTGSEKLLNFDVYWWTKQVQQGESHTEWVQLEKGPEMAGQLQSVDIEAAPWVDGELMRLSINTMTGMEIGTLGYIARQVDINGKQGWSIQGYQIITANNSQQYTQVDAELDSFAPITGRTKNDQGDFIAKYDANGIDLTIAFAHGKKQTQNIKPDNVVYDNEQVLYLLRRLPLKEGFQTKFKIFSIQTGAIVDCQINVASKESITAPAGTFDCYKTILAIYSGTIKALEHKLWFSADNNRYVVKYDSGAAIMELVETGIQQQEQEPLVIDEQAGLSITLPAEWRFYKNPSPSPYTLSWQLLPPESKAWAVLTGVQRILGFDSARTVADMDIEVLKGFFKDYVPRENSWVDLTIDGAEAVSYEADYSDKGGPMVEYRTYILGKSQVYWFVFRVEKDKFEENKVEFDSIMGSFKSNAK